MPPIISIEHLTKTFQLDGKPFNALSDVSLEVQQGEIFGIIGLSGAGKSTLVRCINLLESPTSGTVLVRGQELTKLSAKELRLARRKISMIFQGFHLLMQRTCLQNVCFPLELQGVAKNKARERALELLRVVGLEEKANSYPAQLSGGQKQRVAIARALATDPDVLLCDEATSALDPKTTHAILELIRDINEKLGITVIVITHQMSVVQEICNRVAILENGEVVEEGTVADVFSNPKADATRNLVYPEMADSAVLADEHGQRVRLIFNGALTAREPLIARMAMDAGVEASILGASTRSVGDRAYGYILLEIMGGPDELAKAVKYLRGHENVTVQVEVDYAVKGGQA